MLYAADTPPVDAAYLNNVSLQVLYEVVLRPVIDDGIDAARL